MNLAADEPISACEDGPISGSPAVDPPWEAGLARRPRSSGGTSAPGSPQRGPSVVVHDRAAYRHVLLRGSIGLAQSYAEGLWDCEELVQFLRIATRNLPGQSAHGARNWPAGVVLSLLAGLRHALATLHGLGDVGRWRLREADLYVDRQHVRAHYDLGNEFFALFLDPTLTYSCATFEAPGMSLQEASLAKLDSICQLLDLRPGDDVLEIGTGWGSFALRAAGKHGCRVTTTTLSERQYDFALRQARDAGLEAQVEVRDQHYLELRGTWDKIACIEMVEALNWRQHGRFFATCSGLLRPGGKMALQAIVIDDRFYDRAKRSNDFIKAMVFPGSTIPSVRRLTSSAARAGFRVCSCRRIGPHYVETLARWRQSFLDNRAEAAALGFGREFLRLWDLYLAYCQAGFAEGRLDDVQLLLAKD